MLDVDERTICPHPLKRLTENRIEWLKLPTTIVQSSNSKRDRQAESFHDILRQEFNVTRQSPPPPPPLPSCSPRDASISVRTPSYHISFRSSSEPRISALGATRTRHPSLRSAASLLVWSTPSPALLDSLSLPEGRGIDTTINHFLAYLPPPYFIVTSDTSFLDFLVPFFACLECYSPESFPSTTLHHLDGLYLLCKRIRWWLLARSSFKLVHCEPHSLLNGVDRTASQRSRSDWGCLHLMTTVKGSSAILLSWLIFEGDECECEDSAFRDGLFEFLLFRESTALHSAVKWYLRARFPITLFMTDDKYLSQSQSNADSLNGDDVTRQQTIN